MGERSPEAGGQASGLDDAAGHPHLPLIRTFDPVRTLEGPLSYVVGRQYIWVDDTNVHFWSAEGYDGWDESSWVKDFEAPTERRSAAFGRPDGVSLRQKVADEYVAMRMAELIARGELGPAIDRALANHGENKGCQALVERAPALRAALSQLATKPPASG